MAAWNYVDKLVFESPNSTSQWLSLQKWATMLAECFKPELKLYHHVLCNTHTHMYIHILLF